MSLGLGISLTNGGVVPAPAPTYALDFDGINDYVQVDHDATLNIASNMTVSIWFKTTDSSQQTYISKGDSATENSWYIESGNLGTGILRAGVQNSGHYQTQDGSTNIADGNLHQVVALINPNGGSRLIYVDGSLETMSANDNQTVAGMVNSSPLYIGMRDHTNPALFGDGAMDNVAIWNVALDAAAVLEIYGSGSPFDLGSNFGNYTMSSNLISYWKFNEGTGVLAVDSKGDNDAAVTGPTWVDGLG